MVVLSTLRSQQDMSASPKDSTADILFASIHSEVDVTDNTQTASMLHPHGVALPLGPLFSNDDYDQNHLSAWQGHDHMPAPTDGGTMVWFCSACGDGPNGIWQNCCTACSHVRCGGCAVEVTK